MIRKIQPFSYVNLSLLILTLVVLTGCATKHPTAPPSISLNAEHRAKSLSQLPFWKITGKIAFIQEDKRDRVNINWQVNEEKRAQDLNLTSYLGINVLKLQSRAGQHLVKIDGKEYIGKDLDQLVYQLTGFLMPTQALGFWLKGLPYQANDVITFNQDTQLPKNLTSSFNNIGYNQENWHISYDKYKAFSNHQLATKITAKKGDLLIKIIIDNWYI